MSINPTDIDTIPVMDNSFVYETFERMPDGTLMPVSDKTNIQVVAKREKTVIIPNNIQLTYPLQFKVEDLVAGPETTTPKYYTTKSPNKFFIYRKAWVEQFKVEGSDGGSSLININSCDTYTLPYYTSDITAQYHQQPFLNYNMSYNDTSTSSITSSPQLSYDNISSGVSCEGSPR
ncbi:21942_t:CDS:2, partial [Entrophospora sp. SA101]